MKNDERFEAEWSEEFGPESFIDKATTKRFWDISREATLEECVATVNRIMRHDDIMCDAIVNAIRNPIRSLKSGGE